MADKDPQLKKLEKDLADAQKSFKKAQKIFYVLALLDNKSRVLYHKQRMGAYAVFPSRDDCKAILPFKRQRSKKCLV